MDKAEKCHLCCRQAQEFLTRRGEGDATTPTHNTLMHRGRGIVQMETQLLGRENREIKKTGSNTIKGCQKWCPQMIALQQYLKKVSNAELPECAVMCSSEAIKKWDTAFVSGGGGPGDPFKKFLCL